MFKKFDYTGGRTFVVGDIHGEFELLANGLDKLGFDHNQDHLFSVGDLVDRGPQSHLVLDFLANPAFHAVRGNHEQMTIDAGGTFWHCQNGGAWYAELPVDKKREVRDAFNKLPLAIQFTSPSGRQIGVVHAALPGKQLGSEFHTDWNDIEDLCVRENWPMDENPLLWQRTQISRAKKYHPKLHKLSSEKQREFNVANIDHVYFGHTPLKQPLTVGNCTWLDTGAFATGNLTILEVD